MKVYIVWEFCDVMDSVWTTEQGAKDRCSELNAENGPGFAMYMTVTVDKAGGLFDA